MHHAANFSKSGQCMVALTNFSGPFVRQAAQTPGLFSESEWPEYCILAETVPNLGST